VLLAAAVSQLASSSVELVPEFGLVAYATGAVLVLAATIAAAYGPCRRAGRAQPVTALRHE
jgi:ABC-type lipoprotein release transport system permease subunit